MWPLMFLFEGVKNPLPSKLLKYQMCSEKHTIDLSCRMQFFSGENRLCIFIFTEDCDLSHRIMRKTVGMGNFS